MKNTAEIAFQDPCQFLWAIRVNGKQIGVYQVDCEEYDNRNFRPKRVFCIRLANDWNPSNPIDFKAKTLKGLCGQIERHPDKLIKYQL